jgi:hypothetical protein
VCRFRFLDRSLNTPAKREHAAHEFAQMVGSIVNATISHAPITFVAVEGGDSPTWFVAHVGANKLPAPLPLVNGHYLFLYHLLGLRRKEQYLATLEYRYAYQRTPSDKSWIFRYEYLHDPPEPYPHAQEHLHVNATPTSYAGTVPFPGLHLPTGRRVTVERLVRHLIAEHGMVPISPNWETTVAEGEAHFREIQRRRVAEPATD